MDLLFMNETDLKAKLKVEEMRPGCMSCVLDVDEDFTNLYGTLHGGAYIYLAGTHLNFLRPLQDLLYLAIVLKISTPLL